MKLNKKEEILKASERLFNRFGIKKTAVDEIAELANVAKGTIYNYFGNKEGIIVEIIKSKISKFEELIDRSLKQTKDPFIKLKIALTERIKINIDIPFLSDKSIINDNSKFKYIFEEFDKKIKAIISSTLESFNTSKMTNFEKKRILNTILFTIKGIEESVKSRLDNISLDAIEEDIEYLIRTLFSKYTPLLPA